MGLLALASLPVAAQPPVLYSQPAYSSVVRGGPDDLLMLAGSGFAASDVVVYEALSDTTQIPPPPDRVPSESTTERGVATVVSEKNVPIALTVKLPLALNEDRSYVIRARNAAGEWSNPVRLNDARPLWISPAVVNSTQPMAGLPRVLKVIGRNLQPEDEGVTRVRLTGPRTIELIATPNADEDASVRRYVAKAALPANLAAGTYRVQVSRDSRSWISLENQTLTVRPDEPTKRRYSIDAAEYGGCRPNDSVDDTRCVAAALDRATRERGGEVYFPEGRWLLGDTRVSGVTARTGLLVPRDVDLVGSGQAATRLVRMKNWKLDSPDATFTLMGHNTVRGITFADEHVFTQKDPPRPILQLGRPFYARAVADTALEDIVITRNTFDRTFGAIVDGGEPVRRLFVTHNELGDYREPLQLGGNRYNTGARFRLEDSVIAYNTFRPGSFNDIAGRQGATASEIGGSNRLDFSHNVVDGAATHYLYSKSDPHGWGSGLFWHLNDSNTMLLVSENVASCTGDKSGDGPAIAYDANAGTYPFSSARTVLASSVNSVAVEGQMKVRQNDRAVDLGNYYKGHWIQIASGPGLGQVRPIVGYRVDVRTRQVVFEVSPAWDVPPQADVSRITIGRQYWQVYTVGNLVDHRRPLCKKSNSGGRPKGGEITLWGQTADSVVEGNRQYDTDGITLQQAYSAEDPACPTCVSQTSLQMFVDVRGNLVDGEYDWDSACSLSGITGSIAASPTPSSPPPTLSFGLSISHNTIVHADSYLGGAISFASSWYRGPPPGRWPMVENVLIFHNTLRDIAGRPPLSACGNRQDRRMGVRFDGPGLVRRSVLYANVCENVSRRMDDQGDGTVLVCPDGAKSSCGCGDR